MKDVPTGTRRKAFMCAFKREGEVLEMEVAAP